MYYKKPMRLRFKYLFLMIILSIFFVGCSNNDLDLDKKYFDSGANCQRIAFSCDETLIYVKGGVKIQEAFEDEEGCGCQEVFYTTEEYNNK